MYYPPNGDTITSISDKGLLCPEQQRMEIEFGAVVAAFLTILGNGLCGFVVKRDKGESDNVWGRKERDVLCVLSNPQRFSFFDMFVFGGCCFKAVLFLFQGLRRFC